MYNYMSRDVTASFGYDYILRQVASVLVNGLTSWSWYELPVLYVLLGCLCFLNGWYRIWLGMIGTNGSALLLIDVLLLDDSRPSPKVTQFDESLIG